MVRLESDSTREAQLRSLAPQQASDVEEDGSTVALNGRPPRLQLQFPAARKRWAVGSAASLVAVLLVCWRQDGIRTGWSGARRAGESSRWVQGLAEHKQDDDLADDREGCAEQFVDCRSSGCCKTGGQTCFEKNDYFAMCMDSCKVGETHGDDPKPEPWSCRPLGKDAKFQTQCAWAGNDCSAEKRCCQRGFQCLVKDEFWTACAQVEVGPWTEDGTPSKQLPKPEGWDGTEIGGWRSEFQIYAVSDDAAAAGTSLFCFMAILSGSPEEKLVDLTWDRRAGIFQCEDSRIYHSSRSSFKTWNTGQSTLVNTQVFVTIWDDVKEEGKYKHQDWTVKVDADCIFFPDRLRTHLKALRAPMYRQVYVKNTEARYTNGGFLGAIEIFSKTAIEAYIDTADACVEHIGLKSGEDGFLKDCMDAIGVGFMIDELIMHPSPENTDCQIEEFASFHPFKTSENWTKCYNYADGTEDSPPLLEGSVAQLPKSLKDKYSSKRANI